MSDMYTVGGGEVDRSRRVVGVADYAVASDGETLVAYGLGSCVGIGLRDGDAGVAALAHTMLPGGSNDPTAPDGKFVDTAVRTMLRSMVADGATYGSVRAFVVGGARIFPLADLGLPAVGQQTVDAAHAELDALGVSVVAESTGGDQGRTVEFDTATGEALVYTANGGAEDIGTV